MDILVQNCLALQISFTYFSHARIFWRIFDGFKNMMNVGWLIIEIPFRRKVITGEWNIDQDNYDKES